MPQATCHPYKEGQASLMGMSEFKCVILAGGSGIRIIEEMLSRPKPIDPIGVHVETPSHVERLAPKPSPSPLLLVPPV